MLWVNVRYRDIQPMLGLGYSVCPLTPGVFLRSGVPGQGYVALQCWPDPTAPINCYRLHCPECYLCVLIVLYPCVHIIFGCMWVVHRGLHAQAQEVQPLLTTLVCLICGATERVKALFVILAPAACTDTACGTRGVVQINHGHAHAGTGTT